MPLHLHVESTVELAAGLLGIGAALRARAGYVLYAVGGDLPGMLAITDTNWPSGLTVKGAVFGAKVQAAVVEQQAYRDCPDLAVGCRFDQLLV